MPNSSTVREALPLTGKQAIVRRDSTCSSALSDIDDIERHMPGFIAVSGHCMGGGDLFGDP